MNLAVHGNLHPEVDIVDQQHCYVNLFLSLCFGSTEMDATGSVAVFLYFLQCLAKPSKQFELFHNLWLYNNECLHVLLVFYVTDQHKIELNCEVEGKGYMVFNIFTNLKSGLHHYYVHFSAIHLNTIRWNQRSTVSN